MSRYVPPGFGRHFSACSSMSGGYVHEVHPLVRQLLGMAPTRAEVLPLLAAEEKLAEEAALQQAGAQMFTAFVSDLPSSYRERGEWLEALFRTMLDYALSLALQARFAQVQAGEGAQNVQAPELVAYVAAQQVVGARNAAMALYNTR